MRAGHTQQFSYHRTAIKIYIAILLIIWFAACIVLPLWRKEGWVEAEFFLGVSFVLLLILFTNACFLESDIEVNENAISWKIFGWRWKTILWKNINQVRVYSVWDYEQRCKTKMYYFYEQNRRPYFLQKEGWAFGRRSAALKN